MKIESSYKTKITGKPTFQYLCSTRRESNRRKHSLNKKTKYWPIRSHYIQRCQRFIIENEILKRPQAKDTIKKKLFFGSFGNYIHKKNTHNNGSDIAEKKVQPQSYG